MIGITPLYWKLIGGGVAAAALGVGVASWMSRGAKIDRLESWQTTVVLATTLATVEPDRKGNRKALRPEDVPVAIAALKSSKDSCESTLDGIDKAALQDKAIQAKLDKQLSVILDSQDKATQGTRARINDLLTRQATGDQVKDCAIMESDSNAAWDGWRK